MKSASILVLIWTVYYLAKRSTGGVLDEMDICVCGSVAAIVIIMIITRAKRKATKRYEH